MAYFPNFTNPSYGDFPADPTQTGGLGLGSQMPRGILGSGYSNLLDPSIALPAAAAMIGGRNLQESLSGAFAAAAPGVVNMQKRTALNAYLKAKSSGDPAALEQAKRNLMSVVPEIGQQIAAYDLTPKAPIEMSPGSRLAQYDPAQGRYVEQGGASGRGDGSPYDLEQASKAYKTQFGEGANVDINAPDAQWWYKNAWPTYGTGGPPQGGGAGASASGSGGAGGVPLRGPTDQTIVRQERISGNIAKPIMDTPVYKLVSNGGPYLARIHAAAQAAALSSDKSPASLSIIDQELLDSITKLNTGGGQVTEAQVNLVTKGGSLTDKINVFKNYMNGQGGVLSDAQRNELVKLADQVFKRYQDGYTPYYNSYTQKMKQQGVPEASWTLPDVATLSSQGGMGMGDSGGGASAGVTHTWDPQNGLRQVGQ